MGCGGGPQCVRHMSIARAPKLSATSRRGSGGFSAEGRHGYRIWSEFGANRTAGGLIARVVCLPPWWQAAVFHPVGVAIAPLFAAMGRVSALVSRLDGRPDERPMLVVAWHHGLSGKQRSTPRCAFA